MNVIRVLIVDDDEELAGLIKKIIERMDIYSVKTAVNGEDGYEAFFQFKPDIILTDIQMPVKNGFEMVRDIRNHDPGIKTIYMSGNMTMFQTHLEKEKTKYNAGLLEKPFSCSRLTALFHEYQKDGR